VDHAELGSGERLDMAALAKRLIANGVYVRKRMPWQKDWSDERVIQEMLDFTLAVNWAAALLGGRSFGTGNYSMYGAFAVDLAHAGISVKFSPLSKASTSCCKSGSGPFSFLTRTLM